MLTFTDADIRKQLKAERGVDADDIAFLAFPEVDESVRTDLRQYKASNLVLQDIPVRGFVYDVKTGAIREIKQ